jgi:predicted MFS family arabinose efflux permease
MTPETMAECRRLIDEAVAPRSTVIASAWYSTSYSAGIASGPVIGGLGQVSGHAAHPLIGGLLAVLARAQKRGRAGARPLLGSKA